MEVNDATGWPIKVGARVSYEWHPEAPRYSGEVQRAYTTEKYPHGVVEFIDYATRFLRTVRAELVTVRRGETQASREYREDVEAENAISRGRARARARAREKARAAKRQSGKGRGKASR